jgi:hypothetical protein
MDNVFATQEVTMARKILLLSVLAMALAAPSAYAQTPAANAVDPASTQALKNMGAYLLTLKRFGVSTEVTGERVLVDGQKLQHTVTADLDVVRPNKIRVLMKSARNERELYYGKTLSLNTPAQKVYGTLELNGTLADVIDRLEGQYGMQIPLDDLFRFGTPAAQFDKIESAMNAGQDFVDGDLCDTTPFAAARSTGKSGSRPATRHCRARS